MDELFILWTNADEMAFEKMVCMYSKNALLKGWWDKVTVIIWGSTAKLTSESPAVQEQVRLLLEGGVHVSACRSCADQLGVTEILEGLGVEVIYWGQPLTGILKGNQKLLTV